jgi:hypothetical protein
MKTLKAILISSALVVSALSTPLHAQDKGNAASMQDLLKQLENQRYRDSKENRQREKNL